MSTVFALLAVAGPGAAAGAAWVAVRAAARTSEATILFIWPGLRDHRPRGSKSLREKHGGDRGRQVEAGHPLAHRDRQASVGALQQGGAQAVTLGREGENRARIEVALPQPLPLGI